MLQVIRAPHLRVASSWCRLLELFRQYDGDHDGALNINELHTLLHAISPTLLASRADAAYFSVRRSSLPLRWGCLLSPTLDAPMMWLV
jgi:hypothetical protein